MLERRLTLGRSPANEQPLNADVLVEGVPMNTLTAPINRQSFRSSARPWTGRGNHASGTVMVRASLRATVSVSSVTTSEAASATCLLNREVRTVGHHQLLSQPLEDRQHHTYGRSSKAAAPFKTQRTEPVLRYVPLPVHV